MDSRDDLARGSKVEARVEEELRRLLKSRLEGIDIAVCDELAADASRLIKSYQRIAIDRPRETPTTLGRRYRTIAASIRKTRTLLLKDFFYHPDGCDVEDVIFPDSELDLLTTLRKLEKCYVDASKNKHLLEEACNEDYCILPGGQRGPLSGWLWPNLMHVWTIRNLPLKKSDTGSFFEFLSATHEASGLKAPEASTVYAVMDAFRLVPPASFTMLTRQEAVELMNNAMAMSEKEGS
ncbi:hypothetical protein GCM10007036_23940 [Alsobacter metallidurans]|uniref:Uncharacterized protein n=1 Tax=Alsobacter metallidurans TaxID=340221 RepID=A0A917I7G9_9HYPH|nr:hypothetical protein [Alsobacter metallidurans]GGH20404.1 hypothetical protein GCM10007036_23940 [Alsobacter metallidurans]